MEIEADNLAEIVERAVASTLANRRRFDTDKDYLTRDQAAHYCCVSPAKFDEIRKLYGIKQGKFGGRVVYRRADLQDMMDAIIDG